MRNVLNVSYHITKYTEIIEGLKQENLELKEKLRVMSASLGTHCRTGMDEDDSTLVDQMKAEIMANYNERMQVTQTLMGCEQRYNTMAEQVKQCKRKIKKYCENGTDTTRLRKEQDELQKAMRAVTAERRELLERIARHSTVEDGFLRLLLQTAEPSSCKRE